MLFLSGISTTTTLRISSVQAETNDPIMFHAIHSENLQEIMQRLTQSVYDKQRDTAENEDTRMKNIQRLFDNASELYVAAKNLTQALPGFNLSDTEKNVFEGLARLLQVEANNLGYMTENNDLEGMNKVFKRLNDTCSACHDLFRF